MTPDTDRETLESLARRVARLEDWVRRRQRLPRSPAQVEAARRNGAKGGRPRKPLTPHPQEETR
jgi:hypothetical protein